MKRSEIIPELENVLGIETGVIQEESKIADVPQWDSMAILSFIAFVEDQFGLVLDGDQIAKATTFKELFDLLEEHFE